jgi:hypothetical protein
MDRYCVNIDGISDEILAFFGYRLVDENEEFKFYQDKYAEDHIVEKAHPLLYVEDINDALSLNSNIIRLPETDL